jgi:hypothetical protein
MDKNGRHCETGRLTAEGLEPNFDPFDELNILSDKKRTTIINKIKNLSDNPGTKYLKRKSLKNRT